MARRRFFVDRISNGRAEIAGDDALHLTRVLRVEPGQRYEISDNRQVYLAEVELARKQQVVFQTLERIFVPEPILRVHLFASLIKFERFEWMLEKSAELGVEAITPVETARSEKGLERAAQKRMERWRRILREASEQARRARLPEIEDPAPLRQVLDEPAQYRYVLEEAEDAAPIAASLPPNLVAGDALSVLAGPEGGWTGEERTAFAGSGWKPVSLGRSILRSETAAIAALAIFNAAWEASKI